MLNKNVSPTSKVNLISQRNSIQESNADLIGVNSTKFLPGGAFITNADISKDLNQTPQKTIVSRQSQRRQSYINFTNSGAFGARKQTLQKQLPDLELLNARAIDNMTDIKTQRYDKPSISNFQSTKNINSTKIQIQPLSARNMVDDLINESPRIKK